MSPVTDLIVRFGSIRAAMDELHDQIKVLVEELAVIGRIIFPFRDAVPVLAAPFFKRPGGEVRLRCQTAIQTLQRADRPACRTRDENVSETIVARRALLVCTSTGVTGGKSHWP